MKSTTRETKEKLIFETQDGYKESLPICESSDAARLTIWNEMWDTVIWRYAFETVVNTWLIVVYKAVLFFRPALSFFTPFIRYTSWNTVSTFCNARIILGWEKVCVVIRKFNFFFTLTMTITLLDPLSLFITI